MMNIDVFINEANHYLDILSGYEENGELFTDTNFYPSSTYIIKDSKINLSPEKQKWERVDKYYSAPLFQKDVINENTIKQGDLDDYFLISIFYKIAQTPDFIEKLFDTRTKRDAKKEYINSINIKCGAVIVYFHKFGRKIPILIDTLIPFNSETKKPYFSHPSDFNYSPWFCLVEKAYAKLNGSYSSIVDRPFSQIIYNLFGYFSYSQQICNYLRDHQDEENFEENEYLFKKLLNLYSKGKIFGASISLKKINQNEIIDSNLIPEKIYLILKIQKGDGKNFIRLRSPCENHEWNGNWSNSSNLWTQELKRTLDVNSENSNGTFWMIDRDFFHYFSLFYIVQPINSNYFSKEITIKCESDKNESKYTFKLKNFDVKKSDKIKILIQIETNFQLFIKFDEEEKELIETTFFTSQIKLKEKSTFDFYIEKVNKDLVNEEFYIRFHCKHDFDIFDQEENLLTPTNSKRSLKDRPIHNFSGLNHSLNLKKYEKVENLDKRRFCDEYKIKEVKSGTFYTAKVYTLSNELKRVKQDIKCTSMFNHPSIMKFVGLSLTDFEQKSNPVVVTEYAKNGTLKQVLNNKCPEWNETKILINIYGIASAMSYIHSHGLIHRDLRPSNIQEDENFYPKICNFCLSKFVDNENAILEDNQSSFVEVFKDMCYKAPESLSSSEYSTASDVYSFGMIVYELLSNENSSFNTNQIISFVNEGQRPKLPSSIPDCYRELVEQCYSQNPIDRPSFDDIVIKLKENQDFITEKVDKEEYLKYVTFVDDSLKIELVEVSTDSNVIISSNNSSVNDNESDFNDSNLNLKMKNIEISKFDKLEKIGAGHFSFVYKIVEKETMNYYAAKRSISCLNTEQNKDEIDLFSNEVFILSKMNHPCVLKFIGYSPIDFNSQQYPVIVTEYYERGTLKHVLDSEKKGFHIEGWNETKRLINIYGIASAMSYIHSLNIIHRDLKPDNIFLDANLCPILGDFGISVDLSKNVSDNDHFIDYKTAGTARYIAPEIFRSNDYSKPGDVYSFAITLYYILTCEIPSASSTVAVMYKVLRGERLEFNESVPECFRNLICRCWCENPDERLTFDQIVELLESSQDFVSDAVDREAYFGYINVIKSRMEVKNSGECSEKGKNEIQAVTENASKKEINLYNTDDDAASYNEETSDDIDDHQEEEETPKQPEKEEEKQPEKEEEKQPEKEEEKQPEKEEEKQPEKEEEKQPEKEEEKQPEKEEEKQPEKEEEKQPEKEEEKQPEKEEEKQPEKEEEKQPEKEEEKQPEKEEEKQPEKEEEKQPEKEEEKQPEKEEEKQPEKEEEKQPEKEEEKQPEKEEEKQPEKEEEKQPEKEEEKQPEKEEEKQPEKEEEKQPEKEEEKQPEKVDIEKHPEKEEEKQPEKEEEKQPGKKEEEKQLEKGEEKPPEKKDIEKQPEKEEEEKKPEEKEEEKQPEEKEEEKQPKEEGAEGGGSDDPLFITSSHSYSFLSDENLYNLYTIAAKKNDPNALFYLGNCHLHGRGVRKSQSKAASYFQRASDLGHANSQFALACMYSEGDGVPQDHLKATQLYMQAASSGHADAQFALGCMHYSGDRRKAFELFKKSADGGNLNAQCRLAGLYLMGEEGVLEKDAQKAFELYQKAADNGHLTAKLELGLLLLEGEEGVSKDIQKAAQLFEQAANLGDKEAQFNIGVLYYKGLGVPEDKMKSAHFFALAADQQHPCAQFNLAKMYHKGEILAIVDTKKAVELYKKAADQNYAKAQYMLGMMYSKGDIGIEKNSMEAVKYYEMAAKNGIPEAQLNLGVIYFKGDGDVAPDKRRAVQLFTMASESNPTAQYNLANLYQNGDGVERDVQKAVGLYARAAEGGSKEACHNLGVLYETGDGGVERDTRKAFEYYRKGAELGNKKSQTNLQLMMQRGEAPVEDGREKTKKVDSPEEIEETSKKEDESKPGNSEPSNPSISQEATKEDKSDEKHETAQKGKSDEKHETAQKGKSDEKHDTKKEDKSDKKHETTKEDKSDEKHETTKEDKSDKKHETAQKGKSDEKHDTKKEDKSDAKHKKHARSKSKEARKEAGASAAFIGPRESGEIFSPAAVFDLTDDQKTLERARAHRARKEIRLAVECYEESARQGNAEASFELGELYMGVDGVAEDLDKAESCFKAASKDVTQSFVRIGDIYKRRGMRKKAREFYFLAYDAGVAGAREIFKQQFTAEEPMNSKNRHLQPMPSPRNRRKTQEGRKPPSLNSQAPKDAAHSRSKARETARKSQKDSGEAGSFVKSKLKVQVASPVRQNPSDSMFASRFAQPVMKARPAVADPVRQKAEAAERYDIRLGKRPTNDGPVRTGKKLAQNRQRFASYSPPIPRRNTYALNDDSCNCEEDEEAEYHQFTLPPVSRNDAEFEDEDESFDSQSMTSSLSSSFMFTSNDDSGEVRPPSEPSSPCGSPRRKIRRLEEKAKKGDSQASFLLGACYGQGAGVPMDKTKALRYYVKASRCGNADAQFEAGAYYANGKGTQTDKNKAFKFYKKAAMNGHNKAQYAVANFYEYGIGQVQQDYQKAAKWYKKSAKQGNQNDIKIVKKSKTPLLEDVDDDE